MRKSPETKKILKALDEIEIYADGLLQLRDALYIVGHATLGNKISSLTLEIKEEAKEIRELVKTE
jgi:hypothetical protein